MGQSIATERRAVYTSLQAGRAIAALMVVLYHCEMTLSLPKYWHHSWRHFFACGHSGVEFFFVVSGIVILHAHWNDMGRPAQLASYVWKRARRIYPIYWVVLIVAIPYLLMAPAAESGFKTQPGVILQSFLLVYVYRVETILRVAWTLYHEIMFYALFALVIANRRVGAITLALWIAASACTLIRPVSNVILAQYLSPLHLLFGFGIGVLLYVRRSSVSGLPLALAGAVGFIACCMRENITGADASPLHNVAYGLCAALLLAGCMLLEQQKRLRVPMSLKFLGDASYSIYLVHFPALALIAKVLYPVWKHFQVPLIIPFIIMAAAAVMIGVGLHWFIEKPLLQAFKRPRRADAQSGVPA